MNKLSMLLKVVLLTAGAMIGSSSLSDHTKSWALTLSGGGGAGITQSAADDRYVNTAGDTLTGTLVIGTNATADASIINAGTHPVTRGGTGIGTCTDGGFLLGSGTAAFTCAAVLADSEILVGDGIADPVVESGATLRTSIGVGTGDSPTFTALTLSSFTQGSVLFSGASGLLSQNNTNFFWDNTNLRLGIANSGTPQYRLDIGNLSYFAINGNFAHIIQHNNAASTFWSIATRNGGDLDIAVTTTDPRPTSGTIGTGDNVISFKANKDIEIAMGSSTGLSTLGGVADSQFTDVGNVGLGEDTLQTFTLPANALNADGKVIRITATFKTAANANVKTTKLHFGSTVLASSGPAGVNDRVIYFDVTVVRTGASAQRTTAFRVEGVNGALADNTFVIRTTPAEDTTGTIVIRGTGETDTNVNNDVIQESMLIELLN